MPLFAGKVGFLANNNGVAQTGIVDNTLTDVAFTVEEFDIGNYYNNSTSVWTPPAGLVMISCHLELTATYTAGDLVQLVLLKDAAAFKTKRIQVPTGAIAQMYIGASWLDQANGSNAYKIQVNSNTTAGGASALVSSSAQISHFSGYMV